MPTPLTRLRRAMREAGADALYLPTADFHDSEYAGDHFALRRYFSGFDGSAGTLLVTRDRAALWTDGRYFLQAERQLQEGIVLMRQGQPGVPTVEQALAERLSAGETLALDGRCVSAKTCARFRKALAPKGVVLRTDFSLPSYAWPERPPLPAAPVWELSPRYAGADRPEKLSCLRADMAKAGADVLLLTALDEIAWLLNLRGGDIPHTPVFLSYLLLETERATLFVNPSILSPAILAALETAGVSVAPYETVYTAAASLPKEARVLLDRSRVNCRLCEAVPGTILDRPSPAALRKAVKNETEIQNLRIAHLRDGLAVTRFLYGLSTGALPPTELDAAAELEALRRGQADYLGPSFPSIVGFGKHGAIVHYSATTETNAALLPEGFLLADSGGHYLQGSTDTTRTFALGPLTAEQKRHYTAVLRGNLALANAKFPKGCTGHQLDSLARLPLWRLGLDYDHGTGHGVGYLLGVHEGPQSIRSRAVAGDVALAPGMVLSDEPGLYLEGKYGIRLENLMLCVEEADGFLAFETLTLIPFAREAIAPEEMQPEELRLLDAYHARVYAALSPHLEAEEARWLAAATAPLLPKGQEIG